MNKKILLIFIVIVEILVGSIFLLKYYQHIIDNKKVQIRKIATLSDDAIITNDERILEEETSIASNSGINNSISKFKHIWELTPNKIEKESKPWLPYTATYNYNADGLNDIYDYSIEKDPKTFRIITLGDSYTYGHYVNTQDNWTELLEVTLNNSKFNCNFDKFEVINLGVFGYDIQYIADRYKRIGQKYQPDLILWYESDTGFHRLNEIRVPIMEECLEKTYPPDTDREKMKLEVVSSCGISLDNSVNKIYSEEELIQEIQKGYDIFFSLPKTENTIIFFNKVLRNDNNSIIFKKWKNTYTKGTFIRIVPPLSKDDRVADGHPNKNGHKIISDSIYEYLRNNHVICQ